MKFYNIIVFALQQKNQIKSLDEINSTILEFNEKFKDRKDMRQANLWNQQRYDKAVFHWFVNGV